MTISTPWLLCSGVRLPGQRPVVELRGSEGAQE